MTTENTKSLMTITRGQVEGLEFKYSKEHIGKAQFKVVVHNIVEENDRIAPFQLHPVPIDKG